jgi:membrane protease YdiL (CAAX protease family)
MTSDITTYGSNGQTKISGPLLIALHLLPGLIFAGFFFVLSRVFIQRGLTGYLALLITILFCLAPVELGVMIFWSARFTGRRSLMEAVVYNQPGNIIDCIVLPFFLFFFWSVLSVVLYPISQYLEAHLTVWLPAWTTQEALANGLLLISPSQRSITIFLAILLSCFVAPVVEELYFRGFLLPRMEHLGRTAPVVNSFLFAIYHFYSPGNVPGIFATFLPISYVVMVEKNWRIGTVVHSFFNLWGVFWMFSLATVFT